MINSEKIKMKTKHFSLKSGHLVKIHFLDAPWSIAIDGGNWIAAYRHRTELTAVNCLPGERKIVTKTRREMFQKLRLAIAEEMNPQIREVRQRISTVDRELTMEMLRRTKERFIKNMGHNLDRVHFTLSRKAYEQIRHYIPSPILKNSNTETVFGIPIVIDDVKSGGYIQGPGGSDPIW